jgi:hypothetical protein
MKPPAAAAPADRTGRPAVPSLVHGSAVCRVHGASAPQVRNAARRRLEQARLNGEVGQLMAELEVEAAERDPVALLLDALHRCSAMVAILGGLVAELELGDLFGPDPQGATRAHVATETYATWLDRSARAAKLAIDAGIEERRVLLAEEQGRVIADLFARVFADPEVALSPSQQAMARIVAARHLRALPGRNAP